MSRYQPSSKEQVTALLTTSFTTAVLLPFDFTKVTQQVLSFNKHNSEIQPWVVSRSAVSQLGLQGIYKGVDAALAKYCTYNLIRLNIYAGLTARDAANDRYNSTPMRKKVVYAAFAGAIGTLVSNPFDTVLTRIQGDYLLPKDQQRGYRNLSDGMGKILNKEGYQGLMLGGAPNMLRSAAFNVGALAFYDQQREFLARIWGNTYLVHPFSAFAAAVVANGMSMPFDNIKTKLQYQTGKGYRNSLDCFFKTMFRERIFNTYAGFSTYTFRATFNILLTMHFVDFLRGCVGFR